MSCDLEGLARRICEAPLAPESWPEVLLDLAGAVGGWSAQIFATSGERFIFDVAGGIEPETLAELNRRGGADPAVSPRARAFMRSAPLQVLCDADYVTRQTRDQFEFYRQFLDPAGSVHATMAMLARSPQGLIGVGVNHCKSQGPSDAEARRNLSALLPHLEKAVQLQLRLETKAARFSLDALEQIGVPGITCDDRGVLSATNALADAILQDGRMLGLRRGKLVASLHECQNQLLSAIARAGSADARIGAVRLRSANLLDSRIADIAPLPYARGSFRLTAGVLIAFRQAQALPEIGRLIESGLTPAEADIGLALFGGETPSAIAQRRGVSVTTVRSQIRAMHLKLGVSRTHALIEFVRSLN